MLQTLCFFVNVNPFHSENLREHALDQVMAKNGSLRDLPSFGTELNSTALGNSDQTVSSQSLEGSGYCWWRDGEPMGEERGDDGIALRLGLGDGLEIILFGNGDHHDIDGNRCLPILYHHSILLWDLVVRDHDS